MKISDFLSQANVKLDIRASDKIQLLRQLATQAAAEVGLEPGLTAQIVKREELALPGWAMEWRFRMPD